MFGVEDIRFFYDEYKKNMDKERRCNEQFYLEASEVEWVDSLMKRAITLRRLYNSNEELLDNFLRPILNGTVELNDELAEELFQQVLQMEEEGRTEYMLIQEVEEKLEQYYSDGKHMDRHLQVLQMLLEYYSVFSGVEYCEQCQEYVDKAKEYLDHRGELSQETIPSLRRCIYLEQVVHSHINPDLQECVDLIYWDTAEFGADEIRDKGALDAISANIIRVFEVKKQDPLYEKIYQVLYDQMDRACGWKKLTNVEPLLYFTFFKMKWLTGKATYEEVARAYGEYYITHSNLFALRREKKLGLKDRPSMRVFLDYLPEINIMLITDSGKPRISKKEWDESAHLRKSYVEYVRKIPVNSNDMLVAEKIYQSFVIMLPCAPASEDLFDLVMSTVMERDEAVTIHSYMVAELSTMILNSVFEHKPELLVGVLDTTSVEEVQLKKKNILEYMKRGALLHDLGKMSVNYATKKQTRKLNDKERKNIQRHPTLGFELVENIPSLVKYKPLILGHHKTYDNLGGYPVDYDYREQPNAVLVNILQVADCLDAATDRVGRVYSTPKDAGDVIGEFVGGKGTVYNPDIVDILVEDDELQSKINDLTTYGKMKICRKIFNKYR